MYLNQFLQEAENKAEDVIDNKLITLASVATALVIMGLMKSVQPGQIAVIHIETTFAMLTSFPTPVKLPPGRHRTRPHSAEAAVLLQDQAR